MPPRPPHRLADALFRLLAARPGARAAGIFALGPSGLPDRRRHAELDALRLPPLGPWLAPQLPLRDTRPDRPRLGPARRRLRRRRPDRPPGAADPTGFLLVADRRAAPADPGAGAAPRPTPRRWPRRCSPRDGPPPGRAQPAPATALKGAIRPRAAAQRLVEAALRRRRVGGPAGADDARPRPLPRRQRGARAGAAGDALLAVTGARLEQALDAGRAAGAARGRPLRRRRAARRRGASARWPGGCCRRSASRWSSTAARVVMQASIGIVAGQPPRSRRRSC